MMQFIIRTIDLFTFSHGSNWNKQEEHDTLMWLVGSPFKCHPDMLRNPPEEVCPVACTSGIP